MVCDRLSRSMETGGQRSTRPTRRRFLQAAGVASAAGLSGCTGIVVLGGTNTPPNATTVRLWTLFTGGDGVVMKNLVDKFNEEHDDIFIDRQRVPWAEYYKKVYASLTSRTAPDIAISHASRLRMLSEYLVPYEDVDIDRYLDVTHEQVTYDGKFVALPLDIHSVAHYYNKEIFEEAGLDPENPPTNWEEFKPAMDTIVEETPYTSYEPGADGFCFRTWLSWVTSAGERFLTNETTTPTPAFNTPRVVELTDVFDSMVSEWDWTAKSGGPATDAFTAGNHAVIMNGTWAYSLYKESANNIDFDWGVFTVSTGPNKKDNLAEGDSHTIIMPWNPNRSKKTERAARTAAKWLSTHPYWPLNSGHIPSTIETYDSKRFRTSKLWDKTMHLFAEQAKNGNIHYEPATERNSEYRRIMQQALIGIRTQNKETKQALTEAASQLNRVFDH